MKQNNIKLYGLNLIYDYNLISSINKIFFNYNRSQFHSREFRGFMESRNLFDNSNKEN